jgi:predicted nuclease of restriction endonuclease-like (RecB) superfamily
MPSESVPPIPLAGSTERLLTQITALIQGTKTTIASSVNASLVILNWQIGEQINREILSHERAEYGQKLIAVLALKLKHQYGPGFSRPNLFRMSRFARLFPNFQIVSTLSRQLSWSHFLELLVLEPALQRDFYAEMCRLERWSVRALKKKIGSMLYERVALSKKPERLIEQELEALRHSDYLTPAMILQDPYILDFLELKESYSEKNLEDAIIAELTQFLLELGNEFCFLARQKRMSIGDRDYYLDLLFYHRRLRRLVAIELKLEEFSASHKGQMELYLRWLDKYEKQAGEQPPLGIILCARKDQELVELLELDQTGIHVAEYLTELPPLKLLQRKFQEAVAKAQEKIARQLLTGAELPDQRGL